MAVLRTEMITLFLVTPWKWGFSRQLGDSAYYEPSSGVGLLTGLQRSAPPLAVRLLAFHDHQSINLEGERDGTTDPAVLIKIQ